MPRPVSPRRVLARMVKQHGYDMVAGLLRDFAAAPPRLVRKRGRPKRPKYDDAPLVRAAAARWRRAGGHWGGSGDVWSYLHEVAGGNESVTRRLLRRLDEWGAEGCEERGIGDFNAARWKARLGRALERALDRYDGDTVYIEWALHVLAGGYRRGYHVGAADAEVLFRSIPSFAAHLKGKFAGVSDGGFDYAWAAVRHLSASRFTTDKKSGKTA